MGFWEIAYIIFPWSLLAVGAAVAARFTMPCDQEIGMLWMLVALVAYGITERRIRDLKTEKQLAELQKRK